jgi:HEAT repeat protein
MNARKLVLCICAVLCVYLAATPSLSADDVAELIREFKTAEWPRVDEVATALASYGEKAIEPLIELMESDGIWVSILAPEALAAIGEPAFGPLSNALGNKSWRVRVGATEALAILKDKRAVGPLLTTLKDSDWCVRDHAASALGTLGDTQAGEALTEIAGDKHDHLWVRIASVSALGHLSYLKANKTLLELLRDRQEHVRIRSAAAEALGMIREPRAVEPLVDALKEPYVDAKSAARELVKWAAENGHSYSVTVGSPVELHMTAAKTLGKLGDPSAIGPLAGRIDDVNTDLRLAVVEALAEFRDEQATTSIKQALNDWHTAKKALEALEIRGWVPECEEEQVYAWAARREGEALRKHWEQTKAVLLSDVLSSRRWEVENSVFSFVGAGEEDVIPELVETLHSKGNKTMAEVYLNSGNTKLRGAAEKWAQRNGYTIGTGRGTTVGAWGSW